MKTLQTQDSKILLLLLIAVCVAWIITPESGAKRELKDARKALIQSRDSVRLLRKIQEDSTEYYMEIVKIKEQQRLKAEQEKAIATRQTQIAQRKYESIKFVNYSSDSKRDSVLAALYPSFRPIR